MALEIMIVFNWAYKIGVYDRARAAVFFLVTVAVGSREENYLELRGPW